MYTYPLSWHFVFVIFFSGVLRKSPMFVLRIANLIVHIVYFGLDLFQWNFASCCIGVFFLPHYFCIKFGYNLKFLPSSQSLHRVSNLNASISSQICRKHQEIYPKFFFLLQIFFKCMTPLQSIFIDSFLPLFRCCWIKRGLFAFAVYLFNLKEGGWIVLGYPPYMPDYF